MVFSRSAPYALTLLVAVACPAYAQSTNDPAPPPAPAAAQAGEKPESIYDRIWKFTDLYSNESNPAVQRVLFTGRFQEDYAGIDSDQGDLGEWNVRRMRLGGRVTLFKRFLLHSEVELNPQEADPFYVRFTDLYLQWSRNSQLVLQVGKQGVPFTLDGATSSKDLITIDRSNLANNIWFPQEYIPGVSASGRRDALNYRVGVYSAGAANRELGEFSGSWLTLGVVGYDFAKKLDAREALLTGNYVYQPPDADNTFTRSLEHIVSGNFRFEARRWGLRSDVSAASGSLDQGDLWGLMVMPFVNATDKLQFVTRYTLLGSPAADGIRLATYESRVASDRGDEYNELYLGANYYFYGHRLKLQTGVQWADMKADEAEVYSGVSWTTGLRIGW